MMHKKNKGFTLIELIVTIVIASILVGVIFMLLKSYRQMSSKIKSDIDSEFYVSQFIDTFSDEIASSGNQPIDSTLPSIYTYIYNSGKIINFTYNGAPAVSSIGITTDLNTTSRQVLTYTVKAISPVRSRSYSNELGIYKSKSLDNTNGTSVAVFNDALVLPGVKSFQCTESENPTPVNANAKTRSVSCSLVVYAYLNLPTPQTKTYNFYAKAENQF
jgi:prepilin-type N-terminal cleavage/methylation domain-containing protein